MSWIAAPENEMMTFEAQRIEQSSPLVCKLETDLSLASVKNAVEEQVHHLFLQIIL